MSSVLYDYLRRKENGKQREYEERTRAAKKAKIEAKKAALRAEDMGKGVFVPVGSSPKNEPMKVELPTVVNG